MRSVMISAKTREEAIRRALEQLGVERHEVHVEIIEEGSRGILGFGARDVKIRVTAEHLPDEPPARAAKEKEAAPPAPPPGRAPRPRPPETKAQNRDAKAARQTQRPAPVEARRDREQTPPSRRSSPLPAQAAAAPSPAADSAESIESGRAKALLEEMIRLMGIQASVQSASAENSDLLMTVSSEDPSLLIGRKGRTLQAIQYLINRMVRNGDVADVPDRILVDVAGYVDRRKTVLEEMALRLAQRAKETGKRIRIKPMSPQERRIIHVALQNDPDVRTFSVGEAGSRCVIIAPKDERPARRSAGPRRDRNRSRRPSSYAGAPRQEPAGSGAGGVEDARVPDEYEAP